MSTAHVGLVVSLSLGAIGSSALGGCGNGARDTGQGGGSGTGAVAAQSGVGGATTTGGRGGSTPSGGSSSGTTGGAPAGAGGSSGNGSSGAPLGGAGAGSGVGGAGAGAAPGGASGQSASGGMAPIAGASNAGSAASGAPSGGSGGRDGAGGMPATCVASTLEPGNSKRMLTVGGASRSYVLHVPAGYTGTTPVPLVLDFHGLGGSGMQQQSSSGFQQVADREGFLVAFPDGIDNAWNIGPCCTNSRDVDDLGFAKAMIASISADGCVDPKRVYAAGFSMGGGISQYLACHAADVFAAVAPSSFDLLVPEEEPCEPSRPISVIAFRGTADTVVPFAGGQGSSGRVTFMGAQASFERWAEIDACMGATTSDGDCTYYEQCSGGAELGLCVKQGGSHAPGDASVGWAFLSRFTLP